MHISYKSVVLQGTRDVRNNSCNAHDLAVVVNVLMLLLLLLHLMDFA